MSQRRKDPIVPRLLTSLSAVFLLALLVVSPAAAQQAERGPIATADDLLRDLETVGNDIRTLSARVRYTRIFALEGDEQVRDGNLWYLDWPEGENSPRQRGFAIQFDRLRMGDRIDEVSRRYAFDGEWLLEADGETRVATRRQVVAPGERFDPLKLGEGPFPVPIGQKRDEILERFAAELLPADIGLSDPQLRAVVQAKPTYQLRLTPRERYAEDMELAEIRLWYPADTLLPRLAWTRSLDGNESWVLLTQVKLNDALPPGVTDTTPPSGGWDVQIMPYRDPRLPSAPSQPGTEGGS